MVIIRINGNIHPERAKIIVEGIHNQAPTGVIVVPNCCELLNEVPEDQEIKVIHQDARVAELEKELAAAMAYITAQKDCPTCKHENMPGKPCEAMDYDCLDCDWEECICTRCHQGSKWEWRGA